MSNQKSVNRRIILSGLFQVVFIISVATLIIVQNSQIASFFNRLVKTEVAINEQILKVSQDIYRFRMPLLVMLSMEDEKERIALKNEAFQILSELDAKIEFIRTKATSNEEIKRIGEFEQSFKSWVSVNTTILNLGEEGKIDEAKSLQKDQGGIAFKQMDSDLNELSALFFQQKLDLQTEVEKGIVGAKRVSVTALFLLLLFSLGTFVILRHKLVSTLNLLIDRLTGTSKETNEAANLISQSALQIAKGADSQAAAVEESSSSLQQINASAESTATGALQADALTQDNSQILEAALTRVNELTKSMESIIASSEESKKVIGVIDQIAFQTNLLALNAAVEAARAGEAGSGFAVVAEEVRMLANKSAEAAKTTGEMIGTTISHINKGQNIVNHTLETFGKLRESSNEIQNFVISVKNSVTEQSTGLSQVVLAYQDIDRVVQSNATLTQQSNEIGERLMEEIQHLNEVIHELEEVAGA